MYIKCRIEKECVVFMKIELLNQTDFELAHIFECGQCFRWKKQSDGSYIGVVKNGIISVTKNNGAININSNIDSKEAIYNYFDLSTDYSSIKEVLSKDDINLKEALKYGYGIRILNQDPWEMLISFIISAANNIPRISKTIENISKAYGQKICFENEEYYLFPTPEELSKATIEDLRELNLGFRDKYVYNATRLVLNNEVDLDKISLMPYKEAKKELVKIPGVGEKVADCILLFSMQKKESFPVDTWIKKVMSELYLDSQNVKKISEYADMKFGQYAGIAQQYLFYWRRENSV